MFHKRHRFKNLEEVDLGGVEVEEIITMSKHYRKMTGIINSSIAIPVASSV